MADRDGHEIVYKQQRVGKNVLSLDFKSIYTRIGRSISDREVAVPRPTVSVPGNDCGQGN